MKGKGTGGAGVKEKGGAVCIEEMRAYHWLMGINLSGFRGDNSVLSRLIPDLVGVI